MRVRNALETRLRQAFSPSHLGIEDESHMHSGPDAETHFKVVVVSEAFAGQALVARHQAVYGAVGDLMKNPIHALAIAAHTPEEWAAKGCQAPDSPACLGGDKA